MITVEIETGHISLRKSNSPGMLFMMVKTDSVDNISASLLTAPQLDELISTLQTLREELG